MGGRQVRADHTQGARQWSVWSGQTGQTQQLQSVCCGQDHERGRYVGR